MSKTIEIVKGKYFTGGENKSPVAFLRKVVADQKEGEMIDRPECDLGIAGTIIIDGINLIKQIECRTPNCSIANCIFNKK